MDPWLLAFHCSLTVAVVFLLLWTAGLDRRARRTRLDHQAHAWQIAAVERLAKALAAEVARLKQQAARRPPS